MGNLSPAQSARPERRTESALRLAESVSATLMDRVDISPLRGSDGALVPRALLGLEAGWLRGERGRDGVVEALWTLVAGVVASRRYFDLAPISECLPFQGRTGDDLDPFLPKLLGLEASRGGWEEPPIRGTNPRADNPRITLTPTGAFAKRDLGGLPSDLGRLAPTELLMLRESGSGPPGGKLGARRVAYRTMFLHRAVHGQLLQRYSHGVKPAEMEPVVFVQVDLLDDPELHRLTDPPNPPVISWYRAVAVELVHTLARLSKPFRWQVTFRVQAAEGPSVASATFPPRVLGDLGASRYRALELLSAGIPEAFASRRGVRHHAPDPEPAAGEVDLWLRVVLGSADHDPGLSSVPDRPRTSHERGVHVERLRNGDYGIAVSEAAVDAHLLRVELDRRAGTPVAVARDVVSELLGDSPEELRAWQT